MDIFQLIPLLRCPETGLELEMESACALRTTDGGRRYPIVNGVPVFTPEGTAIKIHPATHTSNALPAEALAIIASAKGPVLNLSAGGTPGRPAHVVEFEYSIFRNTEVAGDVHRLPFADDSFDAVVCLNAFEHYRDPRQAAAEVRRVLRPGGKFFMHTAGLQPLHEPPHHYYNVTRYGLAEWLKEFGEVELKVSDNFNPGYALAWIASDVRLGLATLADKRALKDFSNARISELADLWARPETREKSRLWRAFQMLPAATKEACAAGWQATAVKTPLPCPVVPAPDPVAAAPTVPDQEMIFPKNNREFEQCGISDHVKNFPAMLGFEERQLPAHLARSVAAADGTMVELGCYLGGSTAALLEGALLGGADRNKRGPLLHSYDLFVANDYMVDHSLKEHGVKTGESFVHVFKRLLGANVRYVETHPGDIRAEVWQGGPISLLYVDILWGWDINRRVIGQFYTALRPGSRLIHQDYIYSFYPWLPVSMEWLVGRGYFSFESFAKNSTVSFLCEKSPDADACADFENFSTADKCALLRRSQSRFTGYPRELLRLSEAVLIAGAGASTKAWEMLGEIKNGSDDSYVQHHCAIVEATLPKP
jgi:SAM-dependent methyltransferase/uncharacterized protein YbaR (Trm112 family)